MRQIFYFRKLLQFTKEDDNLNHIFMTKQKFNNTQSSQSSTEHPKFTIKIYFYVKVFILKFVTETKR